MTVYIEAHQSVACFTHGELSQQGCIGVPGNLRGEGQIRYRTWRGNQGPN